MQCDKDKRNRKYCFDIKLYWLIIIVVTFGPYILNILLR